MYPTQKSPKISNIFFCEKCTYNCFSQQEYAEHILTDTHKNLHNPTKKSPKLAYKFFCESCNYKCCKQNEYNKHMLTNKHKTLQHPTSIEKTYTCNCGKIYKHSSTLYTHKKRCQLVITSPTSEKELRDTEPTDKELIMILIKENTELKTMMMEQHTSTQNMMMEVIKTGTHNTTNTNSHNKTFNLQFFLNETCKDAMNITDFVNSIQLQLSDLVRVGESGYVDGISNIIIKNLKQLDVTKRPVHCTDKKREVLYVKDANKWEKEDTENKIIRTAIKKVSHKNILMLPKFKDAHPDCSKSDSKYSDQYNKITIESFGGPGDDDSKKEDKIIKNISKTIVIERESDPL